MWHFFKHRVFSFKFENVSITYENKNEEWDIYSDSDNNKSNKFYSKIKHQTGEFKFSNCKNILFE